ncbi:MAG: hypothetical protein AB1576_03745 [Bacillota bacterium]
MKEEWAWLQARGFPLGRLGLFALGEVFAGMLEGNFPMLIHGSRLCAR